MEDQKEYKIEEKLEQWKKEFYEDTGKLSDIVRNIAFAGIALIWIFNRSKTGESVSFNLPSELLLPLKMIVGVLILDIFQYVWRSITIYVYYKIYDIKYSSNKLTEKEGDNAKLPEYIATGSWILFIFKIVFIAWAYVLILSFLNT